MPEPDWLLELPSAVPLAGLLPSSVFSLSVSGCSVISAAVDKRIDFDFRVLTSQPCFINNLWRSPFCLPSGTDSSFSSSGFWKRSAVTRQHRREKSSNTKIDCKTPQKLTGLRVSSVALSAEPSGLEDMSSSSPTVSSSFSPSSSSPPSPWIDVGANPFVES